jgi:hypothetical protein
MLSTETARPSLQAVAPAHLPRLQYCDGLMSANFEALETLLETRGRTSGDLETLCSQGKRSTVMDS